jgi:hypothetical protein
VGTIVKSIALVSLVFVNLLLSGSVTFGADRQQPNSNGDLDSDTTTRTIRVAAQVVVDDSAGGARPERRVGAFTIPKDTLGVDIKYDFNDPNIEISSTKLGGGNVFSVTENRYLRELESVQILVLPPGEYTFEVGGTPGSKGELTITVAPGTPLSTTRTNNPSNTVPPPTGTTVTPPGPSDDEQIAETSKAIERSWSGQYTIEKITGNVSGMGQVLGKRAMQIKFERDEMGMNARGAVWMPPAWFGNAGGGIVEPGQVVRFHVLSKQFERGVLSIFYKGIYDPKSGTIKGTLIGYRPKGESSEAVFEGTWYLNPR